MYKWKKRKKKNEKERNEELYAKIEEFINRCKEELEKVINDFGGYEKESYNQDNNKDLKNLDLKKRLVEAFNPKPFNCPDTKKSLSFFKNIILFINDLQPLYVLQFLYFLF